jgi:hypothetical protein
VIARDGHERDAGGVSYGGNGGHHGHHRNVAGRSDAGTDDWQSVTETIEAA